MCFQNNSIVKRGCNSIMYKFKVKRQNLLNLKFMDQVDSKAKFVKLRSSWIKWIQKCSKLNVASLHLPTATKENKLFNRHNLER